VRSYECAMKAGLGQRVGCRDLRRGIFVAVCAAAVIATPLRAEELPDFGGAADAVLSKSRERQLGHSVLLQLRNAGVILEDPLLTEYINVLGSQLASHAHDGDFEFQFFVINDSAINAFAMPGGTIGVNSGLILASENESELAGVLAHEVSHVTQRHIARSLYEQQRSSMLSIASMIAAVLLGATTDASGEAVSGILTAGQAAAMQQQLNFSRAHEQEADRIGIDVLSAAGFDPNGMSTFFEKLARRYGTTTQVVPEFLRSHPMSTSRVAEARGRARQLPPAENVSSASYELAKARLSVLAQPTGEAAMASIAPRADSNRPADRYARALAYMRISFNDEAERLFRDLVQEFPGVIAYRIGHAESLLAAGLERRALAVYETAIGLFPRNVPLTISYGEALIAVGEPEAAHKILLDLLNNVPPTPAQIQLIARAANAEGDIGNAHSYMAEYYLSIGSLPLAMNQLRMALESPDANAVDRSRYRARLDQIIEAIPEEEREHFTQLPH
jgi:predicted Zn-dependent protease